MKRKREHFILDGYNIIHSWPELAELAGELKNARDRLIDIMLEYGAYEHYDITIVFDALFTTDEAHEEKINPHFTIIYTDQGETADSYIERLAYEWVRRDYEVHVVTSDGAEQTVILGVGAYRLPSREFRRMVYRSKEKMRERYVEKRAQPLLRNDVGSRLTADIAEKLDKIRKNQHF